MISDEGLSGLGEAYGPATVTRTVVEELYRPRLVGRDPLDTQVLWEELYNAFRDYGRQGMPIVALSAVDIALWDLKGKALGLPPNPLSLSSAELLFEYDRTPNPLRENLSVSPPVRQGDVLGIPSGPRLGLELDRELLRRYSSRCE